MVIVYLADGRIVKIPNADGEDAIFTPDDKVLKVNEKTGGNAYLFNWGVVLYAEATNE